MLKIYIGTICVLAAVMLISYDDRWTEIEKLFALSTENKLKETETHTERKTISYVFCVVNVLL